MKEKIKVLVADDHAIVRIGIRSLLATARDCEFVGQAEDGAEAVALALKLKPDVVIMDLMMPVKDGVEATAELHKLLPDTKVILLTTFVTSDGIAHALENGAYAAVLKSCAESELISVIRKVHAGESYISPDIQRQMKVDPPVPKLTARQQEILGYMICGKTNKEIAALLDLQVYSVDEHIETIIRKVGASNRTEAVAIALRKHLQE